MKLISRLILSDFSKVFMVKFVHLEGDEVNKS